MKKFTGILMNFAVTSGFVTTSLSNFVYFSRLSVPNLIITVDAMTTTNHSNYMYHICPVPFVALVISRLQSRDGLIG